jgi:hypothetical protein
MNLKKIWSDPVWSKVISVIIIASAGLLYTYISAKIDNLAFQEQLLSFLNIKISLWLAIILFFIFTISIDFSKRIRTKFKYDSETLNLDKAMFEKLKDLLPQDGSISRFRSFATFLGFEFDEIENFRTFKEHCRRSDFDFFHPTLEKLKRELLNKIEIFTENFYKKTKELDGKYRYIIPSKEDDAVKHEENKNEFEKSATELIAKYDELIKSGRKVLKM